MRTKVIDHPLRALDPRRAIILDNETCSYCGIELAGVPSDKEHVIGRRFVPLGKLDGSWNLFPKSCRPCNAKKAALEDDISALTMQPTVDGEFVVDDPVLRAEAARKGAGSFSPRTGRPVSKSSEKFEIRMETPTGIQMTFEVVTGPQIDDMRAFNLAWLQLRAFFYWITYNEETRRGGFWPGVFVAMQGVSKPDWGNAFKRGFMETVKDWAPRLLAIAADGYYRAIIRRKPDAECWSWGVEWNKNYRAIGLFGDKDTIDQIACRLPVLQVSELPGEGVSHRVRIEKALEEETDTLFAFED